MNLLHTSPKTHQNLVRRWLKPCFLPFLNIWTHEGTHDRWPFLEMASHETMAIYLIIPMVRHMGKLIINCTYDLSNDSSVYIAQHTSKPCTGDDWSHASWVLVPRLPRRMAFFNPIIFEPASPHQGRDSKNNLTPKCCHLPQASSQV